MNDRGTENPEAIWEEVRGLLADKGIDSDAMLAFFMRHKWDVEIKSASVRGVNNKIIFREKRLDGRKNRRVDVILDTDEGNIFSLTVGFDGSRSRDFDYIHGQGVLAVDSNVGGSRSLLIAYRDSFEFVQTTKSILLRPSGSLTTHTTETRLIRNPIV